MDLGADVSTVDTLKYATHRLRAYCGVTVTWYNEGTTLSLGKHYEFRNVCGYGIISQKYLAVFK
jgi:hypothetical protein